MAESQFLLSAWAQERGAGRGQEQGALVRVRKDPRHWAQRVPVSARVLSASEPLLIPLAQCGMTVVLAKGLISVGDLVRNTP